MLKNFSVPAGRHTRRLRAAYGAYKDYKADVIEKAGVYCVCQGAWKEDYCCRRAPVPYRPGNQSRNHELIGSLDLVLITEDCIAHHMKKESRNVLNQWTYQARMYEAARYVCTQPDMQLVQLVSFGCGTDAITTDELRDILESGGKLYTPIKIDDINNLGAIRIRIRSLVAAIEAREE